MGMGKKKKILFVIDSLRAAGAEKSLVTLLNCFDCNKYEIYIMLLSETGEFIPLLPQHVLLVEAGENWRIFGYSLLKSIKNYLVKGNFRMVYHRLLFAVNGRLNGKTQKEQQKLWKHMSPAMPKVIGRYDAAIGYLEKYPVYTVVEKVDALKKIGWIHIDYKSYGLDSKFDSPYFERLHQIVTISGQCKKVLCEVFPEYSGKISVIENIVSPSLLNRLAGEPCEIVRRRGSIIVTLARLSYQKGIDMAVDAAKLLQDNGYEFDWYVLGDGPERAGYERMIERYGLKGKFHLQGIRVNPYPYIEKCDIYVQPSRFEGKSIALEEVKAICRPIVVTSYPTLGEQLVGGFNCITTEVNARGIYEGIKKLLDNAVIGEELCRNLKKPYEGNETEISKLYALI